MFVLPMATARRNKNQPSCSSKRMISLIFMADPRRPSSYNHFFQEKNRYGSNPARTIMMSA
jgi:hypothetical protein